jgi:diguanylate cyclase (GGDEF)-like protein/PAS domain S-box-containing protein
MGVPLRSGDHVLGVVAVQSYQERALYTHDDLDLLTFVAENVGQAIQRKNADVELRRSEKRFRGLFEASPDAIFVEDLEGNVLDANPAAANLQGIEARSLIGMNVQQLVPPDDVGEVLERHRRLVLGEMEEVEALTWTANGKAVPVEVRATPLEYAGRPAALIQVRDLTERKEHEQRLEYLARFDALTGLPNRFLFEDRLRQAVVAARRSGERLALHYLDLDEFKQVNDTLGHSIGDELLKAAGRRLAGLARESDTVARLSGDEFAIIQAGIDSATAASAFAMRVLEAMLAPFSIGENEVQGSTSIGITLSTPDEEPEELLVQADRALYKAKEKGRGSYHFHDETLAQEVQEYVSLRQDLGGAIERGELFVEYQPQIDLQDGGITGCEALIRWQHPRRGLLPPGAFIPVTEKTGLIIPIGAWVLREACRQRRQWCDRGLPQVPIAVNLSAVQFRDPRFARRLHGVLEKTGVRPGLLELELTETLLMQGPAGVQDTLRDSHARGVSIAIDDFGTGYSSLQYLREFPIGKLKIAMEFVQGVTRNSDDDAIVAAVISLGHQLGMKVLAEGVESERQVAFLRDHGCDEAQGFFFSRPIAAETFAEQLAK